ncbi:MAG: hypothetical protein JSV78_05380 [Phycisphaerales bacterium]|nr:MAG: hypothetical protein JSV78_05380 [Phycisphaerales bacterium]
MGRLEEAFQAIEKGTVRFVNRSGCSVVPHAGRGLTPAGATARVLANRKMVLIFGPGPLLDHLVVHFTWSEGAGGADDALEWSSCDLMGRRRNERTGVGKLG